MNSPKTHPAQRGPILFIHGMYHGAWCWQEPWLRCFKNAGFAVDPWNLPGHGGTCCGGKDFKKLTLDDYGRALVEKVSEFRSRPILVGHSLGALLIEMNLRQLNPRAVVLVAPTRPSVVRWTSAKLFARYPCHFLASLKSPKSVIFNDARCRAWFFCGTTPEEVVADCFDQLEEESRQVCIDLLKGLPGPLPVAGAVPILVIGGRKDKLVTERVVKRVAAFHGTTPEFFDCGHDLMLEPAWEEVARCIIDCLDELLPRA